jgi:hypothetical protein
VSINAPKDWPSESVLIGAFKGMGDLMSAAPVVLSELNCGRQVCLIVFQAVQGFVKLLDWGTNGQNLEVLTVPDKSNLRDLLGFLRRLAALSPGFVWISPHAPLASRSWRVPLTLWLFRVCFWRNARLAGAETERMGRFFDFRVPVDRTLPLAVREWTAYTMLRPTSGVRPEAQFRGPLADNRRLEPLFDILIHPGANAENRKWPVEHFVELIGLLPPSLRVALLGLPADIGPIVSGIPADRNILSLTGSLEDAIAGIARTRILLSMDSGTTVFAQALRVPTVALYGPVDPVSVVVSGGPVRPIYERRWSCQPCGDSSCRYRINYCMRGITPVIVARELLRLLREIGDEVHNELDSKGEKFA